MKWIRTWVQLACFIKCGTPAISAIIFRKDPAIDWKWLWHVHTKNNTLHRHHMTTMATRRSTAATSRTLFLRKNQWILAEFLADDSWCCKGALSDWKGLSYKRCRNRHHIHMHRDHRQVAATHFVIIILIIRLLRVSCGVAGLHRCASPALTQITLILAWPMVVNW